jgi:hypothetical protein
MGGQDPIEEVADAHSLFFRTLISQVEQDLVSNVMADTV